MKLLLPRLCGLAIAFLLPVFADASDAIKAKTDEVIVSGDRIKTATLTDQNATGSRLNLTVLETPATVQSITGDVIRLHGDVDVVTSVTRSAGITSLASTGSCGPRFWFQLCHDVV